MSFCIFCGKEIADNASFCNACGRPVNKKVQEENKEARRIIYDGEIHKCPNCGEIISAFEQTCASCGYELRGNMVSKSLTQFENEYKSIKSNNRKMDFIRNSLIPNNKEDILEFSFFAAANIDVDAFSFDESYAARRAKEGRQKISIAWMAKLEQVYYKASVTFSNDPASFNMIKKLYDEKKEELEKAQKKWYKKGHLDSLMPIIFMVIWVLLMVIVYIVVTVLK